MREPNPRIQARTDKQGGDALLLAQVCGDRQMRDDNAEDFPSARPHLRLLPEGDSETGCTRPRWFSGEVRAKNLLQPHLPR